MDAALRTENLNRCDGFGTWKSESNRLAGLLAEAALTNDAVRLATLRDLVNVEKRKIETDLNDMGASAQQKRLSPLYQ